MQRYYLIFFTLIFSLNFANAQTEKREKQLREKYEREMKDHQDELISDFVETLDVDDFQKEIITQKLHSYAQKKQEILKQPGRELEKRELVDHLDNTHFSDVAAMSSPEVMSQIHEFITRKTPPKKKKKKKNNSEDSEVENK